MGLSDTTPFRRAGCLGQSYLLTCSVAANIAQHHTYRAQHHTHITQQYTAQQARHSLTYLSTPAPHWLPRRTKCNCREPIIRRSTDEYDHGIFRSSFKAWIDGAGHANYRCTTVATNLLYGTHTQTLVELAAPTAPLAVGDNSDAYSTNLKSPQRGADDTYNYLLHGGAILNHGLPASCRCHCQWRVS